MVKGKGKYLSKILVLFSIISGYIGMLLCSRISRVSQCCILKADGGKGTVHKEMEVPQAAVSALICTQGSGHSYS